jgi:bifunctional non-homologous end joining protein LigD
MSQSGKRPLKNSGQKRNSMSLVKYRQKRSFKQTPEPTGGKALQSKLRFVIQKHAASHLHYDFRLEMEGVLKSWAVPKGPSLDPSVKRLAMMVEDHPFDYRNFEGIIPEGNYGAGTVMLWDEGTFEPVGTEGDEKKIQDKEARHQLHSGKLKFNLHGKKLKGQFALVKAPARGENSWLLMKLKDKEATASDVLKQDKSVVSKKTIEDISTSSKNIYGSKQQSVVKKKKISQVVKPPVTPAGTRSPFPSKITPMLATLVDKPFDKEGWVYEVKWDGYRALALMNGKSAELKSRNDKPFNAKFYPVYEAIKSWGINAVIDGEIVVINDKGISDFEALQNWRSEADGALIYYVFDILWYDGRDLTGLTLLERRNILKEVVPADGNIRLSELFDSSGTEFFEIAKGMGMEGIIAKKADSTYHPGARTTDWLKIKSNKRQEVVIGGFTNNDESDKIFSALLVGVFNGKKLVYTGKIGTGFNQKTQASMMEKFKPLITDQVPFDTIPDVNKPSRFRPNPPHAKVTWLKPKLVCEVSFVEMTSDGVMRHPSFEGMRIDKEAKDVGFEKSKPVEKVVSHAKTLSDKKMIAAPAEARKTLLNPSEETQVKQINGRTIKFNNLSKIYWPDDNVSKRDMLNYYYQAAPYILPYLKNRPQSLNRFPNGIYGKSFYQKDVTGKVPDWVQQFLYHSSDEPTDKHFLVVDDEASILLMASLGCIELNPWSSTVSNPDNPDWCIIDLDPGKTTFDHVIQAAQATKKVLDELKVPCYCKTSGSKGIHIYIPFGGKYSYEESKEFARTLVTIVHHMIPDFTSIQRAVSDRGGKLYLDFLQNRPKATLAAPYSLRPKPGATVSMPLHWEEVKKGLSLKQFNIFNAMDRVQSEGDLFKPVLGKGINLSKVVKAMDEMRAN